MPLSFAQSQAPVLQSLISCKSLHLQNQYLVGHLDHSDHFGHPHCLTSSLQPGFFYTSAIRPGLQRVLVQLLSVCPLHFPRFLVYIATTLRVAFSILESPIFMDPVLVIGGCGGLGHHIVKRLLEKKAASDITSFDLNIDRNNYPGVNYIRGSITSREDVQRVLQDTKPRVIFHTASPVMMDQKNSNEIFEKVNIDGTRILLDAIRDTDHVKAVVYTSSSSVVHNNYTDIVNATEDAPKVYWPEQKEFYTHTKAVAEDMVLAANRKHGYKTAALRGCILFGEGDITSIPKIVENAQQGRGKLQVGYNQNLCDYTYLGNAADAHILAAKALLSPSTPRDGRVDGEAFTITNDEPWPFWDFAHAVSAAAGYPVTKAWVVPPFVFYAIAVLVEWSVWLTSFGRRQSKLNRKMVRFFTMTRTFDISKATKRLGYRPEVNMKDAIDRSVAAFLASSENSKKK
ncbi:predicted protein [Histoplasma mississippiense (nom. inval.)]|uniref:predicted protein n=1 Tax=Ajellomyces capsulatus (strain NAm1 / WU24) TaxID=2059318 RepID=UPI000157C5C6|nr:predicted protein [Histoplasma mississippiense (nom. inval.)]EDN08773.1 predicted protein [Histoplasma mississippiense (nom. inval.)]